MNTKIIIRSSILFLASVGAGVLLRYLCTPSKKEETGETIVLPPPNILVKNTRDKQAEATAKNEDTYHKAASDDTIIQDAILLPSREEIEVIEVIDPEILESHTTVSTETDTKKDKEDQKVKLLTNDDFPLKLGSQGERVKNVQVYLLHKHGWADNVTGIFDKTTLERVEKYLKVSQISKKTYLKLNMENPIYKR